jgi:predicted  nucleic acid-binding Zn-ribbon protein
MIVARCVQCDSEFTEEQLEGATGCPTCGTTSLPCDPKKDVTIKINTHELRILTIWADNWSRTPDMTANSRKTLNCILQRLSAQLPDVSLTLGAEIKDLQDAGHDAELIQNGEVIVPSRGKPS